MKPSLEVGVHKKNFFLANMEGMPAYQHAIKQKIRQMDHSITEDEIKEIIANPLVENNAPEKFLANLAAMGVYLQSEIVKNALDDNKRKNIEQLMAKVERLRTDDEVTLLKSSVRKEAKDMMSKYLKEAQNNEIDKANKRLAGKPDREHGNIGMPLYDFMRRLTQ